MMAINLQTLGLDRLSLDEKLELVGCLWDEITASLPHGGMLTDPQREELRRRVADAQDHPEDSVAWEDALAATRNRLGFRPKSPNGAEYDSPGR